MALNTLKSRISYRIKRSKDNVFVPKDFSDLSGSDQVGRILRLLISDGMLIKFGQGVYAKSRRSTLTGNLIPAASLPQLAEEALVNKLKIKVVSSKALERYNSGASTQVPTGRVIAVKGRVSRKMSYNGQSIKLEHVS